MALNIENIVAELENATILELSELVKAIEEKFGVVAAAVAAGPAAADTAANDEPSEVTVTMTNVGGTKVQVIKAVRELTGLGLIDAKKLVDAVPAVIKENISPDEAEKIKEKLMEAGATVEIK